MKKEGTNAGTHVAKKAVGKRVQGLRSQAGSKMGRSLKTGMPCTLAHRQEHYEDRLAH